MSKSKVFRRYKRDSKAQGPYRLTAQNIERLTAWKKGAYLLASDFDEDDLFITYVGQSSVDIADRLFFWMGQEDYEFFYFIQTDTALTAFYAECREFHRYGGIPHLDNLAHPPRPNGHRKRGYMCCVPGCDRYNRQR